jgi:hypothetical protein
MEALMMEAAHTSETSVAIQLRTWQYIPQDSELHTHRHENFKSHIVLIEGNHIQGWLKVDMTFLDKR